MKTDFCAATTARPYDNLTFAAAELPGILRISVTWSILRRVMKTAILSILVASLMGCLICSAQGSQVRRDPQAITVLTAVQSASGWIKIGDVEDATAIGTITYNKPTGAKTSNYTLNAMAKGRVRETIDNDVSVKNDTRLAERRDGKTQVLPPHMAPSRIPVAFPFWTSLELWQQDTTELKYDGPSALDGDVMDVVEITSFDVVKSLPTRDRRLVTQIFYISQTTHLPRRLVVRQPAAYSPFANVPVAYEWMNYRQFNGNGMLIPTKILLTVVAKQMYEVDVQNVIWNSGIGDSSFALTD